MCLVDVRGVGEADSAHLRAPQSRSTGRAATALMLGETTIGLQVRDLRSVIGYLRSKDDLRTKTIYVEAVAVDSSEVVEAIDLDRRLAVPGAHILARLLALLEDDVTSSGDAPAAAYNSQFDNWCATWPYDAIIPGAMALGDLPEVGER